MPVLRTPDECFKDLPGYPFAPQYLTIDDDRFGALRMHYVDEGPAAAAPVLLLHGHPTWSYLYRHVIAELVSAGHRVVAPDLIGYGRSDKLSDRQDYSMANHLRWLAALVRGLDLTEVTVVCQDWGGPLGLGVLTNDPARFARVVVANTILHTSDPTLAGRLDWAVHGVEDEPRVVVQEALLDYIHASARYRIPPSVLVAGATVTEVPPAVLAAYDAPFPDESYTAGMRQMPLLVPLTRSDPAAAINRKTTEFMRTWRKPFVTAFSDGDPSTRGWAEVFQEFVPGAHGRDHVTIEGAGHFLQEDRAAEFAHLIDTVARIP